MLYRIAVLAATLIFVVALQLRVPLWGTWLPS